MSIEVEAMDRKKEWRQWIAASTASVSLFMTGMYIGWPSPVNSKLKAGIEDSSGGLVMTNEQISWMISSLFLGSTVSPIPAGWLMDRYGRKTTLLVGSIMALLSWGLLIFTRNISCVYASRFLGGMWGGTSYCITPIYLCEIAEPRIRGALNTMFTMMVYLGIMFEYCIGPLVSYSTLNVISVCVPLLYMTVMTVIPESPYYHLMYGRWEAAGKAMVWLRCKNETSEIEEELRAVEVAVTTDMRNRSTLRNLVATPGMKKALMMTEVLALLQRLSGSSVFMAYISSAVPEDGPVSGDYCAIIMCSVWIVFGVGSTLLVDKVGRRPLLSFSCSGCSIATASLAAWFFLQERTTLNIHQYNWFPFASFICFGLFFPFGLACIPSIIQGEVFPANIKGLASGITAIVVAVVSFITNKLYQTLSDDWGTYTNYIIFSLSSMYGVYFSIFVLIETRNKTLAEIQMELTNVNDIKLSKTRTNP